MTVAATCNAPRHNLQSLTKQTNCDGCPYVPVHVACRLTHSATRHRVMVSTYLFTSMWTRFGPPTMAQILCNCWPFSIRGIVIFDAYLKRAEVAQLLSESESDYLAFDAAQGATINPAAALVAAGSDTGAAQAGSSGGPNPASLGIKDDTAAAEQWHSRPGRQGQLK